MKKRFILSLLILLVIFPFTLNFNVALAKSNNFDESINDILNGIDDSIFVEINDVLNEFFNDDLSFKDRIIKFLTGEANFNLSSIKTYISTRFKDLFNGILKVLCYMLFVGIISKILNIILSKNEDKIENNTIFYIFYILAVTSATTLISKFILNVNNAINVMTKSSEVLFPLMFSISSLCGNFGVSLYKPLTCFVSYFSSVISNNYLLPLIVFGSTMMILGNLSENIKISGLSKTVFSFYKWLIGIISILYTVILGVQGIVNGSYNGISIKILKYATGSIIPIVGGFLSGGIDVMLSSAILIKNSVGLLSVLYLILTIGGTAISYVITSFIIKFGASICEPILDRRFYNFLIGVGDVINYLASIILLCGYMYFITVIGFIFSTISVI